MNNRTKEFRQKIADEFVKCLEENPLTWHKEWSERAYVPVNVAKERPYRGINRFWLTYIAQQNGWNDPRWCTFNNIKENNWHLQAGSKGTKVEYWMPYNQDEKKSVSWSDFQNDPDKQKYGFRSIYYTVFNGAQIDGIPELQQPEKRDINPSEVIDKISKGMGVPITNDGQGRAYYSPLSDSIHLPAVNSFESDYAYNATALHELAHSTGHKSRLNRSLGGGFGSPEYAYEELIAEISASFLSAELPVEQTTAHMENHKAYIQGWIKEIKEKPETLIKAIQEAEKAADLLHFHAGLCQEHDLKKNAEKTMDIPEEKVMPHQEKKSIKRTNSPAERRKPAKQKKIDELEK